jgi:hypothetical protein
MWVSLLLPQSERPARGPESVFHHQEEQNLRSLATIIISFDVLQVDLGLFCPA